MFFTLVELLAHRRLMFVSAVIILKLAAHLAVIRTFLRGPLVNAENYCCNCYIVLRAYVYVYEARKR